MAVTFASAFRPAPSFYQGGGSTDLVPFKFDVAIGGRPYLVDLASDQFQVGWEPRIRDSVDQGSIPGEATISPQGLWRRSQDSWHLGAGQRYADSQDAQYGRFWRSVGVDPFTVKGELRLLVKAEVVDAQTESNLFMARANGRIYGSDGQTLRFATAGNFGSPTTVTGTAAANITGLASDGFNVYITQGSSGIYKTDAGVTTAASYVSNITVGPIGVVKGRLMVGGTGANQGKLWNIIQSGNNPSAFYTHPNAQFKWVGFAEGQNHIYCAGHTGAESLIYRTQIEPDGTALKIPVVAGTLPLGEVVTGIYGYLGFLFIGSNQGVRMATADQNGDLIFGALIETGSAVNCFGGNSRFVFFGWTDHPSGFSGVGCIDLSYLTAANTPAYASWYYAPNVTGTVVDLTVFDDSVIFSVAAVGFLNETTTLVDDGYLDTGAWVWGIPDAKILAKIDGRHGPLPAVDTVRVAVFHDDDPNGDDCGCVAGVGSPFTLFTPNQRRSFKIDARVRLLKSAGNVSPVFNRINFRAFVNPVRSQVIRVPLLIHPLLRARDESEVFVDVLDELTFLQNLNRDAFITTYQDSMQSARVLIEDVLQIRDNNRGGDRRWAGTVVVTMRTVDEG
jgi:hypothetical protein